MKARKPRGEHSTMKTESKHTPGPWQTVKLDGIPYIDCKTFKKWQESGYIVKKGEKSKISGITWISNEKDDDEKFIYPKQYNLFHKSQVTEL